MNNQELDALFAEWAHWCRSKCLYAPSQNPRSILGTLRMPSGSQRDTDRPLDPMLARLHLAILSMGDRGNLIVSSYLLQPYYRHPCGVDEQGKTIWRRRSAKEMAIAAGVSIENWRRAVHRAAREAYRIAERLPQGSSASDERLSTTDG